MDIIRVLRAVEEAEGKMAALYKRYEQWFERDVEAGGLFRRLGQQEAAHQHVLSFEIKMVSQNRNSFGEVNVDPAPIQKFAAAVDLVQKASTPPTLAEAVRLALQFEQEAGDEHYCLLLTRQGNPGIEALVKSMHNLRAANHAHLGELKEFALRRGFSPAGGQAVAAAVAPAE